MDFEDYIKKTNHWHKTSEVKQKFLGKTREKYLKEIFSKITPKRILAITGIRRSGKSTLIFQTIDRLIKHGINPKKILHVKVDDFNFEINDFQDILKSYEQLTGFNVEDEKCYIFVDEIQKLKNWQNQFKRFIDQKYNSTFVVSGSSRTLIYKDANESLLGRIRFLNVFPLTFREFLEFNNIKIPEPKDISKIENIKKFKNEIDNEEKIIHYFNLYLNVGGFPEWFSIKDKDIWYKILKEEYLDLFLFRDVVSVFKVKNPNLIQKLFVFMSKNSANRFSYNKLSGILDFDKETLRLYISYLESAGLIYIGERFSKNESINEQVSKKIYVWEEGLRRSLSFDSKDDFSYENVLTWHLQKVGLEFDLNYKPKYYLKNYKVDYIFRKNDFIMPIEVKNTSGKTEVKGVLNFMKEFNLGKGVVVTKNKFDVKENLYYIPLWMFLLFVV